MPGKMKRRSPEASAYVLLNVDMRQRIEAREALLELDLVKSVDLVGGPFDLVLKIEANNTQEIADFVNVTLRDIPGAESSIPLVVLNPL
jgi:DNA-binding Lrp family transcriptional regulator